LRIDLRDKVNSSDANDQLTKKELPLKKFLILSIFSCFAHHTVIADPILSVSASSTTLSQSDSVTISYMIKDLTTLTGDSLSAFDLDILFDPTILVLSGFTFSDSGLGNQLDFPELAGFGFAGDASALAGVVDVFGISGNSDSILDAQQANEFVFLNLTFDVISNFAATDIAIDLVDSNFQLLDSAFNDFNVLFESTSVSLNGSTTTPVPSPGTLSIFLISLLTILHSKQRYL
jgi:hypothetical protein